MAFALASVIWGVPYLFIEIAVRHGVTPLALAWGRVTLGALVLLGLAWRAGTLRTLHGRWRWLLAYAVAEICIPFPMLAFGEQRVPSSLAAIMVASVPLIGALLAMRFDHSERPTPVRALGLLIGFCGVIALVGLDVAGHKGELLGVGAIMLTATGYAIGPMLVKHRLAGLDPRASQGAGLAHRRGHPAALRRHRSPEPRPDPRRARSGGRARAAVHGRRVRGLRDPDRRGGPSRATVITYVNPVVAVRSA